MSNFNYKCTATLIKFALVVLSALISLSGCGRLFFHETFKVDPAAVEEVRSVGRVVLQVQSDWTWEGSTQIDEILLMDVGSPTYEESRNIAYERLRQLGWAERANEVLESHKWGHIAISFDSLDGLDAYGPLEQPLRDAALADQAVSSSLILVDLAPLS
ncbi:hypothetical protein [Streptosporangium sp. NPDC049644]|uniref:hypothetical protein n=1 Tax=Streptosporangium sp. NPDC049644 TaxID=3155507 RepID=UPI0034133B63